MGWRLLAFLGLAGWLNGAPARAEPPLLLDGGVAVAKPAALPTGLARGFALGVTTDGVLSFGARAAWVRATEHTITHEVTHSDTKLRAVIAAALRRGRGSAAIGARLGATLTHESRVRAQGERAGLEGDALRTDAWRVLPAAEIEIGVSLEVYRDLGVALSAGPALHLDGSRAVFGYFATVGALWRL